MTARQDVLDGVAVALASISTANGFNNNVNLVEPVIRTWDDAFKKGLPCLGFMADRERFEGQPFNSLLVTLPVKILGHINASGETDNRTQLAAELLEDITFALYGNATLRAACINVAIIDNGTDEAQPDYQQGEGGALSVDVTAELEYLREAVAS